MGVYRDCNNYSFPTKSALLILVPIIFPTVSMFRLLKEAGGHYLNDTDCHRFFMTLQNFNVDQ